MEESKKQAVKYLSSERNMGKCQGCFVAVAEEDSGDMEPFQKHME